MNETYFHHEEYAMSVDESFIAVEKQSANQNHILIFLNEISAAWVRDSLYEKE